MGLVITRAGLRGDWRAALQWLCVHGGEAWRKPQTHLAEHFRSDIERDVANGVAA